MGTPAHYNTMDNGERSYWSNMTNILMTIPYLFDLMDTPNYLKCDLPAQL